ncbi:uncharacterized protein LOC105195803 [Solenopsis invicta]|uniref:uncharacterized protein LOC105195803 n=1 Tax=Solenopsis invicta TaxID=13686 RepID=UPI00193EBB95|nr:uncharacterized protein LOC105195803 [Solenopsis invicta]
MGDNTSNLDQQQESAMDLSIKTGRATDQRDCRPTHRQPNLNYYQNYSHLTRYGSLNINYPGSSINQDMMIPLTSTRPNSTSLCKRDSAAKLQSLIRTKMGSRKENQSKRSRKERDIEEKIKAIDMVCSGKPKAAVARDIGVPESTLRGWCKAADKIRMQANQRASGYYKHILTTFSSDNVPDNSRSRSSSRSTPTGQGTGFSRSSGVADRPSKELEPGLALKRMKIDNLSPFAAANMSTSSTLTNDLYERELTQFNLYCFMTTTSTRCPSSASIPLNSLQMHRNNGAMKSSRKHRIQSPNARNVSAGNNSQLSTNVHTSFLSTSNQNALLSSSNESIPSTSMSNRYDEKLMAAIRDPIVRRKRKTLNDIVNNLHECRQFMSQTELSEL